MLRDLVPWKWGKKRKEIESAHSPVSHPRVNDLFDEVWSGWPELASGLWSHRPLTDFSPKVDLSDEGKVFKLTAELPGLDAKDLSLTITPDGDALVLKGEKKQESEQKRKDYYCVERSFGSFQRTIPLPAPVLAEQIEAAYRNGVLEVKLPKDESAPASRRIEVKAG